jgi:protein phosphatase
LSEPDILDKLVIASLSDVGRSRSDNQDAFREACNALGERLLVLADGMGGHRGGGEASRMCVQTIEQRFLEQHDSVETRLRRGIDEANADILRRGLEDPDLGGMGATCVALVLAPDAQGWVAWAGDSRLYRLRAGRLEQLTEDHSLVAEWQKLGVLTPAQAASHPKRNELTRAIGVTREVDPDLRVLELLAGDRYLLCSDGLCGVVDDETLAELLGSREPDAAARALVDLANARGGPDNVTVQIAWIPDPAAPAPEASTTPGPEDPWADFNLSDPEPRAEAASDAVSEARQQTFDLPARPPAAPLPAPAAPRSVHEVAEVEPERLVRARVEDVRARPRPLERGGLHPPSLVAGVLLGIALALAGRAYLDWQQDDPAPAPAPRADLPPAAMPPAIPAPSVPSPESPAPEPERPAVPAAPEPPPAPRPTPAVSQRQSSPPPAPATPEPPARPQPTAAAEPAAGAAPEPVEEEAGSAASEETPTSEGFELPEPVHRFLDAWLVSLARDDAAAHAGLGFPTGAHEFLRAQSSRESYRLVEVDLSPRSTARQTFVRVVLSYAFTNDSGRFRTEDELRVILEQGADGLRFAGYWQE